MVNTNLDTTPLPPNDLVAQDPQSAELAGYVRTKTFGREVREAIARSIELNSTRSKNAEELANETVNVANDLTDRFNAQIGALTEDSEVIDARGGKTTLGQRLDETDAQLAQNDDRWRKYLVELKIGEVSLPEDFPKLPFSIYKKGMWQFDHDFNKDNFISDYKTIYISDQSSGSAELGLTRDKPINYPQFILRYLDGKYGDDKNFKLTFIDDLYSFNYAIDKSIKDTDANIICTSDSPSKFTWIGVVRSDSQIATDWMQHSGNVYKIKLSSNNTLDYPVNLKRLDPYGIPHVYKQVDTLVKCQSTPMSYYLDTSDTTMIYLNKHERDNINDVIVARNLSSFDLQVGNNTIILENLGFLANTNTISGTSLNSNLFIHNCRFFRGKQDTLAVTGLYRAYILDCVAAYPNKDLFNYHATSEDSLAVEVNCVGYGAGQHKFIGRGNQGTGSNNGSTAHNGMYMLRVGSKYSNCEGPVVADIENCYSITIGCEAYDLLDTTTGIRAGFYVHSKQGESNQKPKYVIECKQSGYHFTRKIQASNTTVFEQNVSGHDLTVGDVQLISYELVAQ